VTLLGKMMLGRLEQAANALSPMLVTLSEIEIVFKLAHPPRRERVAVRMRKSRRKDEGCLGT